MSAYSIVILTCSTALSHADCQPNTALDVVRGAPVDNPVMCSVNAQTMMARTDLVQGDWGQYLKVVCTPSKNIDQWRAEIEARKAAVMERAGFGYGRTPERYSSRLKFGRPPPFGAIDHDANAMFTLFE